VLYARGRTIRPDVPTRVLGIDPGGGWTGLTLTAPGYEVLQAFTISRYATPGYQPDLDYHARNAKQWTHLRNSGLARSHAYDQAYVERLRATLVWLASEYSPFTVVVEGMDPSVIHMHPSPLKAETARQTTIAYAAILGMVPAAIVAGSGGDRGKWGQPAHGGAGTAKHYPPALCGRSKGKGFHPNDTDLVSARLGWNTPEALEHPREAYDHITHAILTGLLPAGKPSGKAVSYA
jgi:hypothetical protein